MASVSPFGAFRCRRFVSGVNRWRQQPGPDLVPQSLANRNGQRPVCPWSRFRQSFVSVRVLITHFRRTSAPVTDLAHWRERYQGTDRNARRSRFCK